LSQKPEELVKLPSFYDDCDKPEAGLDQVLQQEQEDARRDLLSYNPFPLLLEREPYKKAAKCCTWAFLALLTVATVLYCAIPGSQDAGDRVPAFK
jgi:hypothetical protein